MRPLLPRTASDAPKQAPRPASGFMRHLMAYGASEVVSKLSRLFVVVMVARALGVEQIGLAAAALAVCDILKGLTENGIGQRIIAARATDLEAVCRRAHHLFWGFTGGLIALQLLFAAALAVWFHPVVGGLVALGALEYVFMPGGLVQAALAMREGKLSQTAGIAGAQVLSANLLSVALVLVVPSALVLVLPRLLTAPLWLVLMRRLRPWTPNMDVAPAPVMAFVRYGMPVMGIELVKALRLHADKLLVGVLLGADGLGVYFMAFNAGLSLATSFVAAFEKVVFPHLAMRNGSALGMALRGLGLIAPVVILQALCAPYYVPLLLGDGWEAAVPVVSILCLCALPLTLWSVAAADLRVEGRPQVEFGVTLAVTCALAISAVWTAPHGLSAMALGYALTLSVILSCAAIAQLAPSRSFANQEV